MVADPVLTRWYKKYNEKFFENRLPHDALVGWNPCEGDFAEVEKKDGRFELRINPQYNVAPSVWKMSLLHEMAHVSLYPYKTHGKRFQDEMKRLSELGAFSGLW